MPIPGTSLITGDDELDRLKNTLLMRHRALVRYWNPLSLRQDLWSSMYTLLDPIQQSKPLGVSRKFISNEPKTGVDAAFAILTRNPVGWRIPLMNPEDENQEERRKIGRIERTLVGFVHDLDELFTSRLQNTLWKAVVQQGLIRGMIWGKFQITTEALQYRHSPLVAEIYDSRLVFPHVDEWGLNHVIIEKPTSLEALVGSYPEVFQDFEERSDYDPNTPALKLEFWSNDRAGRLGINAVLGSVGTPAVTPRFAGAVAASGGGKDIRWLVPPYYHGYTYDELPVVGVPVNGVHILHKPALLSPLAERLQERADLLAMESMAWHGPNSGVAEMGRSILHAVEEQVPQYNELVATIFQHLTTETYPTLIFKTPTGELPAFEPGIGAKVALTPQESVEKLDAQPMNPDAYRLIQLLSEEREKGVLSSILHAGAPFTGTGVLFQQVTNAALNSLEPYHSGVIQFGVRMGTTILAQLQKAAPILGQIGLDVMTPQKTFFRVEFDPATDLDVNRHYRPMPIMKPALPDDLTVRMTAARMALDPRAPMLSLMTVMETILNVDDPMAELDRIWEDMAQRDPVLMPEQMAQAFERLGEPEMAARMREIEFQSSMVEDLKMRQLTGNLGAGGQQPGATPQAGPLSTSTERTGTERPQPEGGEGLGALGIQTGV